MSLEFRIHLNCEKREVTATVKHLESGIIGESEPGHDEHQMQRQALIDLAHKLGRELMKYKC